MTMVHLTSYMTSHKVAVLGLSARNLSIVHT